MLLTVTDWSRYNEAGRKWKRGEKGLLVRLEKAVKAGSNVILVMYPNMYMYIRRKCRTSREMRRAWKILAWMRD